MAIAHLDDGHWKSRRLGTPHATFTRWHSMAFKETHRQGGQLSSSFLPSYIIHKLSLRFLCRDQATSWNSYWGRSRRKSKGWIICIFTLANGWIHLDNINIYGGDSLCQVWCYGLEKPVSKKTRSLSHQKPDTANQHQRAQHPISKSVDEINTQLSPMLSKHKRSALQLVLGHLNLEASEHFHPLLLLNIFNLKTLM